MDGHQLHTVDTQFLQIGNLFDDASKRSLVFHTRARTTREVAHVHLIDDEVVDGRFQWQVVFPIEVVEHHTGTILVEAIPIGLFPPDITTHNQFCVRVEQYLRLIEAMAFFWKEGTIHPEAILYVLIIQVEDDHREHITQPELLEEGDFDKRLLLAVVEEYQRAVSGITGIDREIHHIAKDHSAKRIRSAWAQFQSFILMCRKQIDSIHRFSLLLIYLFTLLPSPCILPSY